MELIAIKSTHIQQAKERSQTNAMYSILYEYYAHLQQLSLTYIHKIVVYTHGFDERTSGGDIELSDSTTWFDMCVFYHDDYELIEYTKLTL